MWHRFWAWWAVRSMGTWNRLSLVEGDVLVLEYPDSLGREGVRHVGESVTAVIPGVRVLVLDGGLTIKGAIARETGWPPLPRPCPAPPTPPPTPPSGT